MGGRLGAVHGPQAFRKAWSTLPGSLSAASNVKDQGDVQGISHDIEQNHRLTSDQVKLHHLETLASIVVGGGHDHGYSHLRGVKEALIEKFPKKSTLGCINIDAHLDVRPPHPYITSGSPFYLAIESGTLAPQNLVEFGFQSHCNSSELLDYVQKKKVQQVPLKALEKGQAPARFKKTLQQLSKKCDGVVISFDLDSVAQAFAPGVSAPQVDGFTPADIFEIMEIAGANPQVISLGVFELNPEHDIQEMTAKLAALSVFHFVSASQNTSRSRKNLR